MSSLTDSEARFLLEIEKIVTENSIDIPIDGDKCGLNLERHDNNDNVLIIHIVSSSKNKEKYTFNVVYNKCITILRIDIGGSLVHINPDGTEIPVPHMHIYRDGFDDTFAIPLPDSFSDVDNIAKVLYDLFAYSNVINRDNVEIKCQGVLFNG